MFNMKYLIIASIQATGDRRELDEKIDAMPGQWDIINLDGTLKSTNNNHKNEDFCGESFIRLAYIKANKDSHRDNRTYLQVDSMEVYVKYHILKNPNLFIADAECFTEYTMGFDINSIVEELGVSKKNIMYTIKI